MWRARTEGPPRRGAGRGPARWMPTSSVLILTLAWSETELEVDFDPTMLTPPG